MLKFCVIAFYLPAFFADQNNIYPSLIYKFHPVERGSFPYHLAVLENDRVHCEASLITAKIGLTAASCELQPVSNFKVLAGAVNVVTKEGGQLRNLMKFLQHEDYETRTDSNIALLKVDKPFILNEFVKTVPIDMGSPNPNSRWGFATGWPQKILRNKHRIILQTAMMYMNTNAESEPGPMGEIIPNNTFAVFGLKKAKACELNVGSPITRPLGDQMVLYGFKVYTGMDCWAADWAVFTRVQSYVDWIDAAKKKLKKDKTLN